MDPWAEYIHQRTMRERYSSAGVDVRERRDVSSDNGGMTNSGSNGKGRGFPYGSWSPESPLTRGPAAAILATGRPLNAQTSQSENEGMAGYGAMGGCCSRQQPESLAGRPSGEGFQLLGGPMRGPLEGGKGSVRSAHVPPHPPTVFQGTDASVPPQSGLRNDLGFGVHPGQCGAQGCGFNPPTFSASSAGPYGGLGFHETVPPHPTVFRGTDASVPPSGRLFEVPPHPTVFRGTDASVPPSGRLYGIDSSVPYVSSAGDPSSSTKPSSMPLQQPLAWIPMVMCLRLVQRR